MQSTQHCHLIHHSPIARLLIKKILEWIARARETGGIGIYFNDLELLTIHFQLFVIEVLK